jgi:hypothetical protein
MTSMYSLSAMDCNPDFFLYYRLSVSSKLCSYGANASRLIIRHAVNSGLKWALYHTRASFIFFLLVIMFDKTIKQQDAVHTRFI